MVPNPFSWTRHFDVLFVDNPVGTGYSYVEPPAQVKLHGTPLIKVPLSDLDRKLLKHLDSGEGADHLEHQTPLAGVTAEAGLDDRPYKQGYVTNQDGVAMDMMSFIHQFYQQYPDKRKADLYLASESYGGWDFRGDTDYR
jgi:vitellogenic carboxypeptidase-like protein